MHVSRSEIETIERVLCNVSTTLVRTTYIPICKLQNTNVKVSVMLPMGSMLIGFYLKLGLHNIKIHASNLKYLKFFFLLQTIINSKFLKAQKHHLKRGPTEESKKKNVYVSIFSNAFCPALQTGALYFPFTVGHASSGASPVCSTERNETQ